MRRLTLLTFLALTWTCSVLHADSANTYFFADIPPAWPKLLRCGTNQFPPFSFADAKGHATGIEVDVVKEVGRRLDLNFEIEVMPWPRLIEKMKAGELDCMFAAFITEERRGYMNFTHVPLHVSRLTVYAHRDATFPFRKMSDLRGKRIGVIRNFKTIDTLDDALTNDQFAQLVYGNNFEQLFDMLAQKRIDAIVVNDKVAEQILTKRHNKAVVALPYALSSNSAFLVFSKHRNFDNLVARVDYALFEIVADGTYTRLFQNYQAAEKEPAAK